MDVTDREITCADCGQPFTFTASQQALFVKKGFKEEPKRCRVCRDLRKSKRAVPAAAEKTPR